MIRQRIYDAAKAPPDIAGVSTERSHANHAEQCDARERGDREPYVGTGAMLVVTERRRRSSVLESSTGERIAVSSCASSRR